MVLDTETGTGFFFVCSEGNLVFYPHLSPIHISSFAPEYIIIFNWGISPVQKKVSQK